MGAAVTRARDQGMNVAGFGANAIFRKIRFESSPLGPDRIEVNYKIPQEDPLYGKDNALVTGNWPTPPDPDPESSLISAKSYVCSGQQQLPDGRDRPGQLGVGWRRRARGRVTARAGRPGIRPG